MRISADRIRLFVAKTPPREVFVVQLWDARAEWRRRHPKKT
jgi:hypothetical protein